MKKLNDLKQERTEATLAYNELIGKEMNDQLRGEAKALSTRIKNLDQDIEFAELAQELNGRSASTVTVENEVKPLGIEFRDFLNGAVNGNGSKRFELRADPILTSTNTGIINKEVANSVDILTSPGEAFLRQLGVTFYPDLTGNFVVPAMAEDLATFAGESVDASSANMAPESLTLAARRVTHTQNITMETLAQTNPAIYNGIVQNLVNGIWNAVTNDVFDTLESDAATSVVTATAAGLIYGDLLNMEASIGGLNIGSGAYVTTPAVKSYLKKTIAVGTGSGDPIWMDNEVNGYPAYGVPAANANKVYFGDFSRMAVGQWGGIEIIVDNLTKAKQGEIVLTAVALFDTGCTNKRALVFTTDVSVS